MLSVACNGIFDDIYDEAPLPAEGDLYIDASNWTQWHYVCLHRLADGASDSLRQEPAVVTLDIPTAATEAFDADSVGIYTYWYDVYGEGISRRELRACYPTARQPEPDHWDLAFHRNNVRTNGGAALETSITDISRVGDHGAFATLDFVADTWNETDVWTLQDRMLQGLVGNQRITVNSELSRWLGIDIPPMPPAFNHNGHVFVVRLADGTYAALRLKSYIGADNVKCRLTIEYKYPL